MNNKTIPKTRRIVNAGIIAAIYTVLTIFANMLGLASGAIQVRLSEALTVLPIFMPEAIPGLAIGCMISNIITGCIPIDIIFGTFATLIGAYGTYALRKSIPLAIFCPVISNTVIVPLVLKFAYGLGDAWWYLVVTVGAGELISCVILGCLLLKHVKKHNIFK
ncbi:MAG: QueT transporter family protein [Clostridia bacterium]|nr:QueT transporter family protein [Clostridia bacterium]